MSDFKVGELVMVFNPDGGHWCSLKPHLGIVIKHRLGVVETYTVVLQDGRKRLVRPPQLQKLSEDYLTNQKNPDTI